MTGHVIRAVAGAMSVTPIRTWRLRDALLHEVNVEECVWDDSVLWFWDMLVFCFFVGACDQFWENALPL